MLDVRHDASSRIDLAALPEWLGIVSRWAVWAALVEFLLLRVVIRFGPMLPPTLAVTRAAQAVLLAGTIALNVAVILVSLAVLIIAGLARSQVLRGLLLVAVALNLIRTVAPQDVTPVGDVIFLLHSSVMLAAMVIAWWACEPLKDGWLHRIMLIILVIIYAALAYPTLFATAARLGWVWTASGATAVPHFIAEGLAVLVALVVYGVYRPAPSQLALAGALVVTALLGGFWFVRPHLASALTQWTVDFATFLPPWLYLLGLACFVYTVIALARSGEAAGRLAARGLVLIALGGLRWDYTYFGGLGLLGYLLLAESWQVRFGKLVHA